MLLKTTLFAGSAMLVAGLSMIVQAASAQSAAQSFNANSISIENFVGRVEIRTGSSSQVRISVGNSGSIVEDPAIHQTGATLAIDGGQNLNQLYCTNHNGEIRVGRDGIARHALADYPVLTITAPATVALRLHQSTFQGSAGDLGALDLDMSCGHFEVGAIAHDANLSINSSGALMTAGIGGNARVSVNGGGSAVLGAVAGAADIRISGTGDAHLADVTGNATVGISGSGAVEFGRVAGLDVQVSGSGDVEATSMRGPFSAQISGSGSVNVMDGRAEPFAANVGGSGAVIFGGTAVDVTVRQFAGGDVDIRSMEGTVDWQRNGRAVMRAGGRR